MHKWNGDGDTDHPGSVLALTDMGTSEGQSTQRTHILVPQGIP